MLMTELLLCCTKHNILQTVTTKQTECRLLHGHPLLKGRGKYTTKCITPQNYKSSSVLRFELSVRSFVNI